MSVTVITWPAMIASIRLRLLRIRLRIIHSVEYALSSGRKSSIINHSSGAPTGGGLVETDG